MNTPHVNTRIAKHMQGAMTAFVERPNKGTYTRVLEEIAAYASLYQVEMNEDYDVAYFADDHVVDMYEYWS